MAEEFLTNVARMIGATLFYSAGLQTAREMYGKSYFALGAGEKAVVDQTVLSMIAANYQTITLDNLTKQTSQPVGFQSQGQVQQKT